MSLSVLHFWCALQEFRRRARLCCRESSWTLPTHGQHTEMTDEASVLPSPYTLCQKRLRQDVHRTQHGGQGGRNTRAYSIWLQDLISTPLYTQARCRDKLKQKPKKTTLHAQQQQLQNLRFSSNFCAPSSNSRFTTESCACCGDPSCVCAGVCVCVCVCMCVCVSACCGDPSCTHTCTHELSHK